ncbi:MAG: DUF559 domain-containing protein [Clostridia bacterium]|nr:DUF559 domain-containing protein [Clostridia bacterium]
MPPKTLIPHKNLHTFLDKADGSQHYEAQGIESDKKRDEYFKKLGIQVLRYSNEDINHNYDGVCEDIMKRL